MDEMAAALDRAHALAGEWLRGQGTRPVAAVDSYEKALLAFGGRLPERGEDPRTVIDQLAEAAEPGLVAFGSGRFYGFVIGGAMPAPLAADWLATAWDQNAGLNAVTPAAAAAEKVSAAWLVDLFGLPEQTTVGFVTGGCMASFTCLAAARHQVLADHGWDVEAYGLQGAPPLRVITPDERHATIDLALRFLGVGVSMPRRVATDAQGRMLLDDLAAALDEVGGQPTIVTAQAGNVNTGASDSLAEVVELAHRRGAWVHVDGAFGLWAAASPSYRGLVEGLGSADSWSCDAHKWLNVPYESGFAMVANASAHRAALGVHADYLIQTEGPPDPMDLVPEFSKRARGFAVWAALRSLGRSGVVDLVDRCCGHAARFASDLSAVPGIDVLNEVVLNQVLLRFDDDDATTRAVVDRVVESGVAYLSPSVFKRRGAMRISVSNWSTTSEDVDVTVQAIVRALDAVRADFRADVRNG